MARKIVTALFILLFAAGALVLAVIFFLRAHDPLKGAEQRIEQYRMSDAAIVILDSSSRPLPGAELLVEQQSHEFLFGCALYSYTRLKDEQERSLYFTAWKELFNTAMVPFFWNYYEPERGHPQRAETKELTGFLRENGITIYGHPLVDTNDIGSPAWLNFKMDIEAAVRQRVEREVADYPEVAGWVVMNEPVIGWGIFPVPAWVIHRGWVEATMLSLQWAKANNPGAVMLVNNYLTSRFFDVIGTVAQYGVRAFLGFASRLKVRIPYDEFLEKLAQNNSLPDAIGIQSHMFTYDFPLWWVNRLVDQYGRFGRPIYFTEVSVMSGPHRVIDWRLQQEAKDWKSTARREKFQAEYVEKFYTLLFSRPEVDAVFWFDFTDRFAVLGAPSGLLRKDFSPKPSYLALHRLIREKWWTRLAKRTGEDGRAKFRGFYGIYRLTVKTPSGANQAFEFKLAKNGPREFVFRLP
jgi:GH35 family endo-1,4-beta-xylanase